MNALCLCVLWMTLSCCQVSLADVYFMPTTVVGPDAKPSNGVCTRNTDIVCEWLLAGVGAYSSDDCIDCTCNEAHGVTCCPIEPFPMVKHPRHCDRVLDSKTCQYTLVRSGRCAHACEIVGYEFSFVEGFEQAEKIV